MKRNRQSYVMLVATACMMLTAFVWTTIIMDANFTDSALPSDAPDFNIRVPKSAGAIEQTTVALRELSKTIVREDRTAQLPVAPAEVPLPAAPPTPLADPALDLTAIVQSNGRSTAVINGKLVHPGDRLDKSTLVNSIDSDAVRVRRGGALLVLKLRRDVDNKSTN